MAIGTKDLAPTELDAFDDERLVAELKKAKEELFNLRFQSATGQLESHGRLKAVRRDIARIYTILRARELGIRTAPSAREWGTADDERNRERGRRRHGVPDCRAPAVPQDAAWLRGQRQDAEDRR